MPETIHEKTARLYGYPMEPMPFLMKTADGLWMPEAAKALKEANEKAGAELERVVNA